MTPEQYCADKVAQSHSSFPLSFVFLPAHQQRAMNALYAFCREVDDIADNPGNKTVLMSKLQWWQSEVEAIFQHRASHPVAIELSRLLSDFAFKEEYFNALIQGMMMDLNHQGFQSFAELERYCYHVASTVGLQMIEITGYSQQHRMAMKDYAIAMGKALQLINIIRDVAEDQQRGRCYLPRDYLQSCQLSYHDLAHSPKALSRVLTLLADQAEDFYQQAISALPDSERSNQRVGLIMANIYMSLLKKMRQQDFPVFACRTRLNPFYKLWIAYKTAVVEYQRQP